MPGSVGEAINNFLADNVIAGYSPLTVKHYRWKLRKRLPLDWPLHELTSALLRSLVAAEVRYAKPGTAAAFDAMLRSFSKWLWKRGLTAVNLMAGLPRPKPAEPPDRPPLTADEQAALMEAATSLDVEGYGLYRLTLLFLSQGLRRKEAAGIRWCDVRWDEDCINVPVTKGAKKHAAIPLPCDLRASLQEARAQMPVRDDEPVLGVSPSRVGQRFMKIATRAGIERAHPHLMRHTWASDFLLRGGSAFALQTLGGWQNPDMIRDRYGKHALERSALDEARRINGHAKTPAAIFPPEIPDRSRAAADGDELAEALRYLTDPRIRAALLALGRAMKGGTDATA